MSYKILLATDLGIHYSYILQYAVELASRLNGRIMVVHALEPINEFASAVMQTVIDENSREEGSPVDGRTDGREKSIAALEQAIHERIIDVIADEMLDSGFDLDLIEDIQVKHGRASEVILAQAEQQEADFMVLGSHNFHLQQSLQEPLGSVAEKVLHHAKIPVFVVPVLDSLTLYMQQKPAGAVAQPPGSIQ